ncbi:MAG TPA: hypothetical protein VIT44_14210 [Cyclobacteriaceae bacterium]
MAKKVKAPAKPKAIDSKITKAQLMKQIDEKLADLNLLKSALQVDPSRTQETFLNYQNRFQEIISEKKRL